jgi:DNA-binding transcriptional ArsR family regulator
MFQAKSLKSKKQFPKFIVSSRYTIKLREAIFMVLKKIETFDVEDAKLAELAKSLSHPARIAILRTLAKKNTCICGEIVEVLPLAQSTVSQHLKELKKAGLVNGEIDGVRSCYCINLETLNGFAEQIGALFQELKSNCC